jgi:hypothetical protein
MKKTLTLPLLLSVILSLSLAGCSQESKEQSKAPAQLKEVTSQMNDTKEKIWQEVTVNYYDFEGGFYGLVTKTGDKLLPMNLAKEFQLPGTVLKVQGQLIKDMMTIQQWGQPFKITHVELISLGKANLGETF